MNNLRTIAISMLLLAYNWSTLGAQENKHTENLMKLVQTRPNDQQFLSHKLQLNGLLLGNADPNAQDPKNGYTALMLAARTRNLTAVEILAPKTNLYLRSTHTCDGTQAKKETVFDQLREAMLSASTNFKLFSSISAIDDEVLKHVDPQLAQRQQLIHATLDDVGLVKDVIFGVIEYDGPAVVIKR